MRFTYPAVVVQKSETHYFAYLPDLPTCEAEGDSLEDCLRNVTLAAHDWIDLEMHEDEPQIPPVTNEEDLVLKEGEFVRQILVIYRILDGWDE